MNLFGIGEGRVSVDVSVENPSSLVGDVLDFITTAEQDEILFEPGAVYYTEGFRVKNNGDIPINFILYISEDDSVAGNFADAFEVYLTNDPVGRGTMVKLQEFKGFLILSSLYIKIRMLHTK